MSEKSLLSGWNTFSSNSKSQLQRLFNFLGHGAVKKSDKPVRIGVLGASQVATYALIWPAKRLADVEVVAVAARDYDRASKYAKQHGLSRCYGSYEDLIKDPDLDAIYIATPNGLHGEWSIKSLDAGKHVLCEKPFTANSKEAKEVQAAAKRHGLMCREAFHYREHPANQEVARLIQSGAIGQLQEVEVKVLIPKWVFNNDDIRFNARLAADAADVLPGGVDTTMRATVQYPGGSSSTSGGVRSIDWGPGCGSGPLEVLNGAVGRLEASLKWNGLMPTTKFTAVGSRGRIEMDNFIMPFLGHTITLTKHQEDQEQQQEQLPVPAAGVTWDLRPLGMTKSSSTSSTGSNGSSLSTAVDSGTGMKVVRQELSVYGSQESNYYYQLDRFAKDLQVLMDKSAPSSAVRAVKASMDADEADAVSNMTMLDNIYTAAGLPLRLPTAQHKDAAVAARPPW